MLNRPKEMNAVPMNAVPTKVVLHESAHSPYPYFLKWHPCMFFLESAHLPRQYFLKWHPGTFCTHNLT
jgi:hypothetical protein